MPNPLSAGASARLVSDDWALIGREVEVVDLEPVEGSSQAQVRLDGEVITVCRWELVPN